jgi:hypothetical protein
LLSSKKEAFFSAMTQAKKFISDYAKYPNFLQKSIVGFIFRILYPFTDEDISDLTEFYRALWNMEQNHIHRQETRIELLRVFIKIKNIKIKFEKDNLLEQINRLENM